MAGYRSGPYLGLLGVLTFLLGPVLSGILVSLVVPVDSLDARIGSGVVACVLAGWLAIFALPPGAIIYTHGFESAVRNGAGIEKLQGWAQGALDRYHEGKLRLGGKSAYWSPGDRLIADSEVPEMLTSGIFKQTGLPNFGPEISICSLNGEFTGGGECIAVSWYLHGLLLGRTDFRTTWNPWYQNELAPGVYSYHGMK